MRFLLCLYAFVFAVSLLSAAEPQGLDYYLPEGVTYDASITTPKAFLGYEIGEWHLRHDQLVRYLEVLSNESPRLSFEIIGRTYEHRPLVIITITSPSNHGRLGEIQQQHLQLGDPASQVKPDERWPVVVNMGYSVHGDESSGANAAPLLAYHLAAAQGQAIDELLANTVILLDPCLNPDGFSRFAQWANSHRGQQAVPHDEHREHNAVWPGGRTNHYWFDLNRDWLLAQHPESQARLAKFHAWRPNVLTDFHEMGSKATYFFQPGVPERKHPLTPLENVTLTQAFAEEHAAALDRINSLYFTQERYDDFYYGKGSTYPDVHGGIGILFEQASSRGHRRESPHGEFDFPFTIRNQVRTSLSTLTAAAAQRVPLLRYQQRFYRDAIALANAEPLHAYVFGETKDASRLEEMLTLLERHQIRVHQLGQAVTLDGQSFQPGSSYVVPIAQPQYRLLKALFETRTTFEDNIFYDVSTWTLPLAFGIPYGELTTGPQDWLGEQLRPSKDEAIPEVAGIEEAYAYAIEWDDYFAPKVLYQLQQADIRVAVSTVPLHLQTADGARDFPQGTLLIPASRQAMAPSDCAQLIAVSAHSASLTVHRIVTGLTSQGVDLGSDRIHVLEPLAPALIVGSGVSHYEAGEAWHLLDHRMGMTIPLLEKDRLFSLDLERYTHLILVDGNYASWTEDQLTALKRWIKKGGILVTQKRATRWAAAQGLLKVQFDADDKNKGDDHQDGDHHESKSKPDKEKEQAELATTAPLPYSDYHTNEDAKRTSGAIFRTHLDLSHPLAYGYRSKEVATFRNSNLVMRPSKNPYATPLRYTNDPLISGYVHAENLERFKNQAALVADKLGKGAVIGFVDNPNFRAFWYGTNKLFLNALFFGQIIEATNTKDTDDASAMQDHHH